MALVEMLYNLLGGKERFFSLQVNSKELKDMGVRSVHLALDAHHEVPRLHIEVDALEGTLLQIDDASVTIIQHECPACGVTCPAHNLPSKPYLEGASSEPEPPF